MLIEFSVGNFRSFRETQTLSLVASTSKELAETNTFEPGVAGTPRLLHTAAIYGANASGKSNLIQAMDFMREFVRDSAKQRQEGEPIPVTPFRLNSKYRDQPSEFEILFIHEKVRYQYGFAATKERIWHEWLLAYPTGKAQRWFERIYDPERKQYDWYFGPKFKGQKEVIRETTRSNALFLSNAAQLNNDQTKPVFDWISRKFITLRPQYGPPSHFQSYTLSECEKANIKAKILSLLRIADLGIDGIEVESRDLSEDDLPPEVIMEIKKFVPSSVKELVRFVPVFLHKSNDPEDMIPFEIEDESNGTRNVFALSGPLLDILANGRVLVVDELDASLHPNLVQALVRMFNDKNTNPTNAQLIFTNHDPSLMEGELLRRDQIWLVEKDQNRASQLYPLTDFSPRKGEALEKGYLRGRYGAVPFIGDLKF